ncbi:hypothetical protein GGR60_002735 [Xanthomonas arboricola]|uniref:hypothetical protein n=1 Tax=Xanthomonas euroxanthea TaxID=2259622 RepID=UPI001692D548|nr:hypothetical protein [Xanthomonas euroxanthea]NJC38181.1 hypothetical protein [Xanthomonas euroxanthea]
MNEQSGNSGQLQADASSGGDAPIDVTDPWRGLYRADRLRANGDGDLYHPDLPSWPDDREDALDKLVRAQGFDFQIVAGDFSEEAVEDGDELHWQEMRAWNPTAPEGDWRLAWKGDTEDGPYAWFVRPLALRPDPEAAAAPLPFEQMHAQLLDMLGVQQHEDAAACIGSLMLAKRSTDAFGVSRGCDAIAGERVRQIKGEGFSPERDRQYTAGELAQAAACYLGWEWTDAPDRDAFLAMEWPVGWAPKWFKPRDRCSDLVRAGALIAAEIDRLLAEQEPRA